jgi:hypothetical protein
MLKRHSDAVLGVMEEQVALASPDIVRQKLPSACLISLLAGSGEPQPTEPAPPLDLFRHSADYREVWLKAEKFDLTTNQSRVVELLHQQYLKGAASLSQGYILETLEIQSKNLSQVFRDSPAWKRLIVPASGRGMYSLNLTSL